MSSKLELYTLQQYAWDENSENGEDGVIDHLLSRLPELNGYCVEFGAWDGKHCSNTYRLVSKKDYKALYIEPEKDRFEELLKTQKEHPDTILALNCAVEPAGKHSLDNILKRTSYPKAPDLLSIDVDSVEYSIWKGFEEYRPKVVVVEFNIYCLPCVRHLHGEKRSRLKHIKPYVGSSLRSMLELTKKKGYVPVHLTLTNIIAVDQKYVQHLQPLTPKSVWKRWLELYKEKLGGNRMIVQHMILNVLYFISPAIGRSSERTVDALCLKLKGKPRA